MLVMYKLEINKDVQFNYSVGGIKNRGVIKNNYFHDIKRSIRIIIMYIILYYVTSVCVQYLYTVCLYCTQASVCVQV